MFVLLCFKLKNMTHTITSTKIVETFEQNILSNKNLIKFLQTGDFLGFETVLLELFQEFYFKVADFFVNEMSKSVAFCCHLKSIAQAQGLQKLSKRRTKIRIASGHYVYFWSYYAEKVPDNYEKSRFIVHDYFKTIDKASPVYASRITQLSVITPSFSVGKAVLDNFNCESDIESNRQLSLALGRKGIENRAKNLLFPGESLEGKRVIIGIDGGRTRIREWDEVTETEEIRAGEASKYGTFDTPWKEPKLLVISSIDREGKVDRKELPIYDACFGDDEIFELLADYLTLLQINKAQSVQVVGDGAPWIWLRAKKMLLSLGVAEQKIVETVDYFHAIEHLNDLEQYLPEKAKKVTIQLLKEQLWEGNITKMKEILHEVFPDLEEKPLKPFNYFEKNQHRMQYEEFRTQKLPIGSGIVESGIRRVINLRFKCPSAFWNLDNLEPLFFLRAAFLAGRWNTLMCNLLTF